MSKRHYSNDNSLGEIVTPPLVIYLLYLIWQFYTDRASFWKWIFYGFLIIIIIVSGRLGWKKWRENKSRKKLEKIIKEIQSTGQEERIINFINRFGFEGRKGDGWSFRNHFFDWERIKDLERDLSKNLVNLRANNQHRDILILLEHYIQKKEEKLTQESIKKEPQKFVKLTSNETGDEFQNLIYRLYAAIGYSVELSGKSGDQGGDVIASREGERLLIQAKCYKDSSTGNKAVQEAVAAMKYYDCKKAVVVTTSYFTSQAKVLAKVNNIELISRERLQKMLLDYLGESWS